MLKVKPEKVIGKYNLFTDNIVQKSGFMLLIKKVFDNAETVNKGVAPFGRSSGFARTLARHDFCRCEKKL
ncbi:MAG: hypothetical protein GYA62_02540 [Bacteroidales bacterium]|nr:hypothetical protein [Bacteroidales bacterium]